MAIVVAWIVKKSLSLCRRPGFNPWVRNIPWIRGWQPTPVFLPGEFHGKSSRGTWQGDKESDTTEWLTHNLMGLPHFLSEKLSRKLKSFDLEDRKRRMSLKSFILFLTEGTKHLLMQACSVAQLCLALLWPHRLQAPLSVGFSRQEYWSGLPCPPPGDLLDPGIEPVSPAARALLADSLPLSFPGSHLASTK